MEYDLTEIDSVLEGSTARRSHQYPQVEEINTDTGVLVLRKRLIYLQTQHGAWVSRKDRMNVWLIQNFAASNDLVAYIVHYCLKANH